jgi:hypothetical protein
MPMIIGRHVHGMNAKIYQSIEPTIKLYWHTVSNDLSSLNGIFAQELLEEIDNYDLLNKVRQDINAISSSSSSWMKHWIINLFSNRIIILDHEMLELDFLRDYISNIKTSLLLELHLQFMDFYTKMQTDMIDQLSDYYSS